LEKLAYKGAMLPIPSLITAYLPAVNRTHMGEQVIERAFSKMITNSLQIASLVSPTDNKDKSTGLKENSEVLKITKQLEEAKQAHKDVEEDRD
jgi:hypothetical protein